MPRPFDSLHAVVTPAHETRCAARDLSDERIDAYLSSWSAYRRPANCHIPTWCLVFTNARGPRSRARRDLVKGQETAMSTITTKDGTHPDLVNRDLLAFCQQGRRKVAW